MKLPLYGSVQREITTNSHFLPMKKREFPYGERCQGAWSPYED